MRIDEIKQELKALNPTLKRGNDEDGYVEISDDEYEAIIESWAEDAYAKELQTQEAEAQAQTKASAEAKLTALGLTADDLKALGLG